MSSGEKGGRPGDGGGGQNNLSEHTCCRITTNILYDTVVLQYIIHVCRKKQEVQQTSVNVWYGRGKNKICYSHTKSDKIWPPDVMYTQEIKGRENLSTRLLRRAPAFFSPKKMRENQIPNCHHFTTQPTKEYEMPRQTKPRKQLIVRYGHPPPNMTIPLARLVNCSV
jgi:hypothetical protein